MESSLKNHGLRVTAAAVGINLALGILYTWSVISKEIPADWGWSEAEKSWPYAIACLVFSLMMVPAGRLQDRIGPRLVATVGGLLVGVGMILASVNTSYMGYVVGFGLLAGTGIGFGYASATPPAVKWFPAARTGMIAGIVVSGFGLASVYAAPLTKWLIGAFNRLGEQMHADPASLGLTTRQIESLDAAFGPSKGVPWTMLVLGIAFLLVVVVLSQFLSTPPKGYVPGGTPKAGGPTAVAKKEDFAPMEMLATTQFYLLWFMYACGAGAGLMVIAKLTKIAMDQAGLELGFVLVATLAIGNGGGRIAAGMLSDKLGRRATLFGCFLMQAALMLLLSLANKGSPLASGPVMVVVSALIGANYGANLSLFPSITKDYYGLKNFGVNYGLVFTAWGIGGFILSLLAGRLHDTFHHFYYSYYLAAGMLLVAAVVVFVVRPPHVTHARAETE